MTALPDLLARVNGAFGWRFSSFTDLIEQLVPPQRWLRLPDWERMGDPAFLALVDLAAFLPETLYVVTDESYGRRAGAFEVPRDGLGDFVDAYPERHGSMMFHSDTFIIGLDSKLVWMFHHEGVWTLFDARLPAAPA